MVSGVPFWLCQQKAGVKKVEMATRAPSFPGAYLRLHPGRLEHEQLNSYEREEKGKKKKKRGVGPSTC